MVTMTRQELINKVVQVYFEGGDWQSYLKQLVKEIRRRQDNEDMRELCEIQQGNETM